MMSTTRYLFSPEEQKLADAYGYIRELQVAVMRLAQREEIDSMLIGLLVGHANVDGQMLQQWRSMVADYYPDQAVRNLGLGDGDVTELSEDLNRRLSFWESVLQRQSQENDDN
jgi:hypothetical protein